VSGSTSPNDPAVTARLTELEATVAAQRAALEAERELRAAAEAERDRLREAYEALKIQVELAHRRLVIAKAERVDTTQLELEFAATLAELDKLAGLVEPETDATGDESGNAGDRPKRRRRRRCDLHKVVGEERIELPDPVYEGGRPVRGYFCWSAGPRCAGPPGTVVWMPVWMPGEDSGRLGAMLASVVDHAMAVRPRAMRAAPP
jgi:hypothetical protein